MPRRNHRAIVAYEGTRYAGSQIQANAPTVQAELERALREIYQEEIRIVLASRTDAGVHATGQVMSFQADTAMDGEAIRRGVNALLPADIAIREVEEASADFHARYSATGRTYEYRIRNAPQPEPLERRREHWLPQALDIAAMQSGARLVVGRHDLAAFAIGAHGERTIRRAEWERDGTLLRFEIEADGFLRGVVRGLVGTLLWVGRGRISPERFGQLMAGADRSAAGPSAPAAGLCLVRVTYDRDARPSPGRADRGRDEVEHPGRASGSPAARSEQARENEADMSTYTVKAGEIARHWWVVDADGATLGRLATRIASALRGKHKTAFTDHLDVGDAVVVVNAARVRVTGKKLEQKSYARHSGYPGGLRVETLGRLLERRPEEVIRRAVRGMLPRNRLGERMIRKLYVYAGPDHPHAAQRPEAMPARTTAKEDATA